MNAEKRPNEPLGSWFVRSGWSKGELARQVNRRARQLGANHISSTLAARRWLDGRTRASRSPRILSELFSERFGCVVAVEDLGLRAAHQSPSVSGVDLPWTGPRDRGADRRVLAQRRLMSRAPRLARQLPGGLAAGRSTHRADAAPAECRRQSGSSSKRSPSLEQPATRRGNRPSKPELDLLESTTVMFRQWDAQCGGGLRR